MSIFIRKSDLVAGDTDMGDTSFSAQMVYGSHSSLMQSVRAGGYHSKPHYHVSEQINLVVEGELYMYTDKEAYHLRAGDILRFPPYTVHWAHNKSELPCRQITVHAPGFQDCAAHPISLLAEGEAVSHQGGKLENLYLEPDSLDIEAIEGQTAIGD